MSEPVVVWQSSPEQQFRYTLQYLGVDGYSWLDEESGDDLEALTEEGVAMVRRSSRQVRIIDRRPEGSVLVVE